MKTWKRAFAIISVIVVFGFVFTGCKTEVPDKKIAVKSVTLNPVELSLTVGQEETLIATVLPANASNKTVTWNSNKQNVATVKDGVVKALTKGTATITVTTKNGKKATCAVTVNLAPQERKEVTGVTLYNDKLEDGELELEVGQTALLTAIVSPLDATNQAVIWSTSKPAVVAVADGTVTARTEGTATITVTTMDGGKQAKCEVTVKPRPPDKIAVTGVTLAPPTLNLTMGGTVTGQLTATVGPSNATNKKVRWTVDKPDIVTITGVTPGEDTLTDVITVTAVKAGDAVITVTTEDYGIEATCNVTVNPDPLVVTGVTLSAATLTLTVGGASGQLTAAVVPATATGKKIKWTVDKPEFATISGVTIGEATLTAAVTVNPVAKGTAIITVTTEDNGFHKSCTVTVNADPTAPTGITLDEEELYLLIGGTATLTATVLPETAKDNITWSILPATGVATVAQTGKVTATGVGDATITVASTKDGTVKATCDVFVSLSDIPVTGVTLNKKTLILAKKDVETLTPIFTPANASDKTVTWSATGAATVDQTGKVTAGTTAGTATITVTTDDGDKVATCAVTVVNTVPAVPGFVWIEAGTFLMGSLPGETGRKANETQHSVTLTKGFYMGETQVTQKQLQDVQGWQGSRFPNPSIHLYADQQANFPAEIVNWASALVYCNLRSKIEGLSPVYSVYKVNAPNANTPQFTGNEVNNWTDIPANWSTEPTDWGNAYTEATNIRYSLARMIEGADGYRLPTEAEWEYACRAGSTTAYNFGANGSDTIADNQANFNRNVNTANGGQTVPVKKYAPNKWGLYDMHGNVFEWCWDWYDGDAGYPNGTAAQTNPNPSYTGHMLKRLRGGSWVHSASEVRSAYRHAMDPFTTYVMEGNTALSFLGLRVVRYIDQKGSE